MTAGRYAAEQPLAGFWVAMFGLAAATLVWVYLLSPLIQLRRPFEVVSARRIAERTWELAVRPRRGGRFDFEAGQFVWLSLARNPFTLHENPFSISSAPSANRVEFVIKEVGDFTRSMGDVREGQRAWLDGPYGNLTFPGPKAPGVGLIAGGVGVAPLLSILREMRARGDTRPVALLYGNRVEAQIVYRDELDRLEAEEAMTIVHVLAEPPPGWADATGQVDPETIATAFGSHEGSERWTYLMCGPPGMLNAAEAALMARGVPAGRIHSERFTYD
jgi:predicted ferric reductase